MTKELILVVDDNRQMAQYMADTILPDLGYSALTAFGGKTALKIIREQHTEISLMLLDLEMPDISGLELLRQVDEEGISVPAIMVTARGSEQVVLDAFRLGVQDYLKKPVDIEELNESIDRALTETRLQREKSKLTTQLQGQVTWLKALSDVGQSVTSTLKINDVLRLILEAGVALTTAEQGFIALIDADYQQLFLRAVKNIDEEKIETVRLPVTDDLIQLAFETGRPVKKGRSQNGRSFKVSTGLLVHSLIHVPIRYRSRPLGVLSVNNHSQVQGFSERDEGMLASLADYAAIAIVNANSFEQAQKEIKMREQIAGALRESEERYALAMRGSNDGLWDWDLITNKVYFSPRWKNMLGFQEAEISESPDEWFNRVHKDDLDRTKLDILTHIEKRTSHFTNEHRLMQNDGSYIWVLCRGLAVWEEYEGGNRSAVRIAGSISDVTDRKKAEERLLHDAFHDALTGLPNRALFMDRLNHTLERAKRNSEYKFAVLFMDLDNFKDINDSIGHLIGDKVLIKVAEIILKGLRAIDTLARFGGDEFIILMEDVSDISGVIRVTEWINEQFTKPIRVGQHEVITSASIGIVVCQSDHQNSEEILRNADIAMYSAKAKGRARAEVFEPDMRQQFLERITLENDLRKAINNQEFIAHYQPIVILESGEMVGFEALVRWKHPYRGLLYPADFISVAEETGLIVEIDHWILNEACHQIKEWNNRYKPDQDLTVSINISGKHITDPELFRFIKQTLQETVLDPKNLKLEITELTIVDQNEFTVRALSNLREMGVQIQIDDFGIGYSSLAYLSRFPINALKIDQSFVSKIVEESSQRDIIRAIVTLTDRLNVNVIAEGVETVEQLVELQLLGCELGQGYYLSHPLDSDRVESLLENYDQSTNRFPTQKADSHMSSD